MLRKHFEDESLRLYMPKINLNEAVTRNGCELAHTAMKAIIESYRG